MLNQRSSVEPIGMKAQEIQDSFFYQLILKNEAADESLNKSVAAFDAKINEVG